MSDIDSNNSSCIPLVCTADVQATKWLEKIQNGIEEEGLFGDIHKVTLDTDFDEILWKACVTSRFSMAVGIKSNDVVLIIKNLGINKPVFHSSGSTLTLDSARILGGNAARYIKCKPFIQI